MISFTKRGFLASTSLLAALLSTPAYADLIVSTDTTVTTPVTLTGALGSSLVTLSSDAQLTLPAVAAPGTGATAITVTGDANPVTISTFGTSSIAGGSGANALSGSGNAGGNGAPIAITMSGTGTALVHETILQNSSTSISGGTGGAGDTAGNGGNGGEAINSSATYTDINLLTGTIQSGSGGNGGSTGGTGGNSSYAIVLTGANSTVTTASGSSIIGGAAGNAGGSTTGNGPNAGQGGGGISLTGANGTISIAGTVTGGIGGNGGGPGMTGIGGNGGTGGTAINIGALSTGINMTVTGTIAGGNGGTPGGSSSTGNLGTAGGGGAGIFVGNLGAGQTGILNINGATITGGTVGDGSGKVRPGLDFSSNTGNMDVTINNSTVRGIFLSDSTIAGGDVLTLTGTNNITSAIYTTAGTAAKNGTINITSGTTTATEAVGITGPGALTAINISGSGTTLSAGNGIYSTVTNFLADDTINMTSNGTQILLGTVTTLGGTAGMGTINSENTSGTDTFTNAIGSSTNYLKAINITSTGTTTALSSVYADTVGFTGDGIYIESSAASNSTIGTVTTSTNGTGTVTSGNSSGTNTFASIGTLANSLKAFNANGGGTGITTIAGGLYADAVTIGSGNTLNVGGDTDGTIDATVNNTGVLNYTGSAANITGDIGSVHGLSSIQFGGFGSSLVANLSSNIAATNVTLASGSTLNVLASKTLTGNLITNGTLGLGTNALTVTGNITGTNPVINTVIGVNSNGMIINGTNTVNPTFSSGLTINTTVNGGGVSNGQSIVIVHASSANSAVALPPTSITVTGTPLLISWKATTATSSGTDMYGNAYNPNDIILTASVNQGSVSGLSATAAPSVNALLQYSGTSSSVRTLLSGLENLSTADLNKAGAQLAPQTNAASQSVSFTTIQKSIGTVAVRNDNIRAAQYAKSGVSSGEALSGSGFWAQAFGLAGRQNGIDGVDGYNSTTFGTAFGADTRVAHNIRVGASASFAKSTVDDQGALSGNTLKVDSYVGTLYGSYTGKPWYVDGNVFFGIQNNQNQRLIDIGTPTAEAANGNYASQQYGFGIGVGYPFMIAPSTTLAPVASFLYTHLNQDSYDESGSSGANLHVDSASTDSLVSATGLKLASLLGTSGGWSFTPNARLIWLHEFENTSMSETASFLSASGSSFVTPGIKMPADTAEVGLGMDFVSRDSWTVSAKYDLELRQDYISNGGMLQIRKDF